MSKIKIFGITIGEIEDYSSYEKEKQEVLKWGNNKSHNTYGGCSNCWWHTIPGCSKCRKDIY